MQPNQRTEMAVFPSGKRRAIPLNARLQQSLSAQPTECITWDSNEEDVEPGVKKSRKQTQMSFFPSGKRRAIPLKARQGYDISIRKATSLRPNETIDGRLQQSPSAHPPECIMLDSDGEDVDTGVEKSQKRTEGVICFDSDSHPTGPDSEDIIFLDTGSDSDSDDVIHVATLMYPKTDDQPRGVGADARKAVEPKTKPAELPKSSHKDDKDEVHGMPTTPLAGKPETRSVSVQVPAENLVLEEERNDVLEVVRKPEPEIVEHSKSSHEDTGDKDQAMPVQAAAGIQVLADKKTDVVEAVPEPESENQHGAEQDKPTTPSQN